MATVRDTIELQDKMSPVLGKIIKSLKSTVAIMQKLDSTVDNAAFNKVERDLQDAENQLLKFNNSLDETPVKINKISQDAEDSAKSISVFGSAIGGFISNVAFEMLDKFVTKIEQSIDYASDLAEVQNVVDVTFGNQAQQINEWSKTALKAYGLNELSAKKYAGTIGAMLTSTGIAKEEILGMSTALVGLAGDMASFYNLSGEEAFDKIKAGISGETEPLKALGINMSDANLEAFALQKNMSKAWKDMSYAEKTMVRYQYLLSTTSNAQGDFSRTFDSYANQQRVFSESLNQVLGLFASNLLPLLTAGMSYGISIFDTIMNNWEDINSIMIISALVLTTYYLPALYAVIAKQLEAGYTGAKAWAIANWPLLALIAVVGMLIYYLHSTGMSFTEMAGYAGKALGFIYALAYNIIANLYNLIIAFIEFFANVWNNPVDAIGKLFLDLGNIVLGVLSKIALAVDKIFKTDYASTINSWKNDVADMAKGLVNEGDFKLEKMESISFVNKMDEIGNMVEDFVTKNDNINPLNNEIINGNNGPSGNANDPINTKVGNKIEISDESIKLMKDVAKIESINRYTTLKPEMKVYIDKVQESADVNIIDERLAKMFEEAYDASLDS